MPSHHTRVLLSAILIPAVLLAAFVTAPGRADDGAASAPAVPGFDLGAANTIDRRLVDQMLDSPHWPFRAMGLLRLERYDGPAIEPLLRARLADEAWQVRIFSIRALARRGLTFEPEELNDESDGRVIRAALRAGVSLDPDRVARGARSLMRTRRVDDLMLGLEIAAASDNEDLRHEAGRRLRVLTANIDTLVLLRINDRLGRLLGLDEATMPQDMAGWQAWYDEQDEVPELAAPGRSIARLRRGPDGDLPFVATLDAEIFALLLDYLGALRSRDLQLAMVMDATSSMLPMVNEARVGVENLILYLDDLARSMELAMVAYRDHDNLPVWEGQPFTANIDSMRDFLYGIKITGGQDLPEAVLAGLEACHELEWRADAERQIILVGDARPHDDEVYQLQQVLDWYRENGIEVHAVHVVQQVSDQYLASVPAQQAERYQAEIAEHNRLTHDEFARIAEIGGGDFVTLPDARGLVPAIMHLTIDETWWPAFDEFYALYVRQCR